MDSSVQLVTVPRNTESISTDSHSSKAPIDPVSHRFEPPLPTIDRAHGCERCNLIVSVAYWCQNNPGMQAEVNDQAYILHRTREDFEDGVRNRCWWCLRLETSLVKMEKELDKGQVTKKADSCGVFLVFISPTMAQSLFSIKITRKSHYKPYVGSN